MEIYFTRSDQCVRKKRIHYFGLASQLTSEKKHQSKSAFSFKKLIKTVMFMGFLSCSSTLLAETCGVAAPAPAPQPEGPGLQVNDTCAFPPPVLEEATVEFPSANGFDNEAMRFPEMQAWISFSELVKPVLGSFPTFLSWNTQGMAYSPEIILPQSEMGANKSLARTKTAFKPQVPLQQKLRFGHKKGKGSLTLLEGGSPSCGMNNKEITHLNPTLVNFLHSENLWNKVGIKKYIADGKKIVMPQGAIEIKTNWVEATQSSNPGFYTMVDASGSTWKLVAMHLISKQLPNWTWATFEHKDNPCYNQYLDTQDSFGFPNNSSTPSSNLSQVFSHYGVNTSIASNYRLVGAMIDFTDDTGRPIILGNSVTENGFQTTSSCITCHARATVTSEANPALSVFDSNNQSFNGPLKPEWYFNSNGDQISFTTDFMWSMVFCAAPDQNTVSPCLQ